MAFSRDGRFVYASLSAEGAVAKVDLRKRRVVGSGVRRSKLLVPGKLLADLAEAAIPGLCA